MGLGCLGLRFIGLRFFRFRISGGASCSPHSGARPVLVWRLSGARSRARLALV